MSDLTLEDCRKSFAVLLQPEKLQATHPWAKPEDVELAARIYADSHVLTRAIQAAIFTVDARRSRFGLGHD